MKLPLDLLDVLILVQFNLSRDLGQDHGTVSQSPFVND